MRTKQILLLSILILVALPWTTLNAQSEGPPLAPPQDAEEVDVQAIPSLPDDFETSTDELENVAGVMVEIMQLQEKAHDRPAEDVIRELREAPGNHGLETDRYNMMVYHLGEIPDEYAEEFFLLFQGIAAEAGMLIGTAPLRHSRALAPTQDSEEPDMQAIPNFPDDFETSTDELENVARAAVEIMQLQEEAHDRPEEDVIQEIREAPGDHGLETDRYNMMVYHFGEMPDEYAEEYLLLLQGVMAEAGLIMGMEPGEVE